MNLKKFLLAGVVGGIVANILDAVVHGQLLQSQYAALPNLFNQDQGNLPWLIFGDFVAVFIFVWVYDRVYSSFSGGPKGGATFGLYAGILANFPTWIFMHLLVIGWPYSLSWIWIIFGVAWGVIVGAVVGALYKK
jgi:hypothetical protein